MESMLSRIIKGLLSPFSFALIYWMAAVFILSSFEGVSVTLGITLAVVIFCFVILVGSLLKNMVNSLLERRKLNRLLEIDDLGLGDKNVNNRNKPTDFGAYGTARINGARTRKT